MAEEERILEVTPDFDGKRIDQCLAASFSDCSRSFLQKLLKDGKVSIIILVQNIKRNVFWLHVQFFRFRQKHQNGITGSNLTACFLRFSVDRNLSGF